MGIGTNPALRALYGPLHGADQIGGLTVWRQGAIQLVLVSLMSLFVVVRHTRAAEETGRLELVGAGVGGPRRPARGIPGHGGDRRRRPRCGRGRRHDRRRRGGRPDPSPSARGLTAAGLVFAGIGAVTAQVAASSRGANGIAGAVLGRGVRPAGRRGRSRGRGDVGADVAVPVGVVPAAAPLRRPALVAAGPARGAGRRGHGRGGRCMRARRDLDSGLVASRPGPASGGPLAPTRRRVSPGACSGAGSAGGPSAWWRPGWCSVAWSMPSRSCSRTAPSWSTSSRGWAGRRASSTRSWGRSSPSSRFSHRPGRSAPRCSCAPRTETTDRAEPVVATAVTRIRWAGSHVTVALLGPVALLALAGAVGGLAAGLVTGRGLSQVGRVTAAALVQLPAVWVLVGLTLLIVGVLPPLERGRVRGTRAVPAARAGRRGTPARPGPAGPVPLRAPPGVARRSDDLDPAAVAHGRGRGPARRWG